MRLVPVVLAGLLGLSGCGASVDVKPDADISPQHLFMFAALPAMPAVAGVEEKRVELGRQLYYETHLSTNNSMSCNSCHALSKYGVDPRMGAVSLGHDQKPGARNAPTVYNAGLEFVQFWDGRAADLKAQATGPMMNPVEMGMSGADAVVKYISANPTYVRELREAYPGETDPVTIDNAAEAIADFEQGLLTPSRWDKYLAGDTSALSAEEKQGLRVFLRSGCEACHAGADMGGNSYEELGAYHDWPDQQTDPGRAQVGDKSRDRMFFKVPTLRNVAETGPYFHDGRVKTLDEAVRLMGRYEVGEALSEQDVHAVVAFLGSLTGQLPEQYIAPPVLPAPTPGPMAKTQQSSAGGQ